MTAGASNFLWNTIRRVPIGLCAERRGLYIREDDPRFWKERRSDLTAVADIAGVSLGEFYAKGPKGFYLPCSIMRAWRVQWEAERK